MVLIDGMSPAQDFTPIRSPARMQCTWWILYISLLYSRSILITVDALNLQFPDWTSPVRAADTPLRVQVQLFRDPAGYRE